MNEYVVAYEFASGAVWGIVESRSVAEVEALMPELHVHAEPPAWMNGEDLDTLRHHARLTIGEPGYLDAMFAAYCEQFATV